MLSKKDFYEEIYKHQTKARGLLSKEDLVRHFNKASRLYYQVLLPYLPQNLDEKVVDIGCGYGNFLYFLKQNSFKNYTGIDFDQNQINLAKSLDLNAEFGDWTKLEKETPASAISALDFLEHLEKGEMLPFLNMCHKRLETKGRLILRVPNASGLFSANDYFNDLTHEWAFTPSSIEALLSVADFSILATIDDRPRLSGSLGILQNITFKVTKSLTKIWLACLGLSEPPHYSRSFWIVAEKN